MRGNLRFLLFIGVSLVLVLAVVIGFQLVGDSILDDLDPTEPFDPEAAPLESSDCWYAPQDEILVYWDADFDGELGMSEQIDAGGPYMILGQSAGYFYIELEDGRDVWVEADAGIQTGAECSGMPFAPGGVEDDLEVPAAE